MGSSSREKPQEKDEKFENQSALKIAKKMHKYLNVLNVPLDFQFVGPKKIPEYDVMAYKEKKIN